MHDRVVVPAEDGTSDRPDEIHPRPCRPDVPLVGHRGLPPFEEAPPAGPRELTVGVGLDHVRQLDPRDPGLEPDGVWDDAAPLVAVERTHSAVLAPRLELLHPLDAPPPLGTALDLVDRIPH